MQTASRILAGVVCLSLLALGVLAGTGLIIGESCWIPFLAGLLALVAGVVVLLLCGWAWRRHTFEHHPFFWFILATHSPFIISPLLGIAALSLIYVGTERALGWVRFLGYGVGVITVAYGLLFIAAGFAAKQEERAGRGSSTPRQ